MDGADDDDVAATPLPDHLRGRGADAVEGAPHGHVDGAAETGHVGAVEEVFVAMGGIRDEDVQAAEFRGCLGNHPVHSLLVGHVDLIRGCPAAEATNLLCQCAGLSGVGQIVDGKVGPGSSQGKGGRVANTC